MIFIVLAVIISSMELKIITMTLVVAMITSKMGMVSQTMMIDFLSLMMLVLTVWTFMSGQINNLDNQLSPTNKHKWLIVSSFIFVFIALSFMSTHFLMFYILFESVFVIMFLMIMDWGYSPERMQSSFYMLFYTLVFSFPLLSLIIITSMLNMVDFYQWNFVLMWLTKWEVVLMTVFLVKIPMYMFHLWLPKAHVEAPIFGSMLLAGLLLKIGGFGISRLSKDFMKSILMVSSLLMISTLLVSIIVLFQSDIKSLIAYSSIAHMVLVVFGIISFSIEGNLGMCLLMIGHGLTSSTLFIISFFMYKYMSTRSIVLLDNINSMNIISLWFFFTMMFSLSFPMTLGFFSELTTMLSTMLFMKLIGLMFIIMLFLFGTYSMMMFIVVSSGGSKKICDMIMMMKEIVIMFNMSWVLVMFMPLLMLILPFLGVWIFQADGSFIF